MEDKIDRLTIKADRTGIAVYVPESMSVNDICCELYDKIQENVKAFQKSGTVYMSFRGRYMNDEDSGMIISFLNDIDMINVSFRMRHDIDQKKAECTDPVPVGVGQVRMTVPSGHRIDRGNDKPYIFRGNIGRKQTLEIRGNVIILGDVAKDATIISGKSIIVVGRLAGTAIAGKIAGTDSFVMAMHMDPRFIQIGSVRCTAPRIKDGKMAPMIATNDGNAIDITYI